MRRIPRQIDKIKGNYKKSLENFEQHSEKSYKVRETPNTETLLIAQTATEMIYRSLKSNRKSNYSVKPSERVV